MSQNFFFDRADSIEASRQYIEKLFDECDVRMVEISADMRRYDHFGDYERVYDYGGPEITAIFKFFPKLPEIKPKKSKKQYPFTGEWLSTNGIGPSDVDVEYW